VVQLSAGVAVALGVLGWWVAKAGAGAVMALYGGPLLVINAWLITYTWLQHTDVDVPHLSAEAFSFMRCSGWKVVETKPAQPTASWLCGSLSQRQMVRLLEATQPAWAAPAGRTVPVLNTGVVHSSPSTDPTRR
jgi:hypothetical protein